MAKNPAKAIFIKASFVRHYPGPGFADQLHVR
jgi:hypothetical protein